MNERAPKNRPAILHRYIYKTILSPFLLLLSVLLMALLLERMLRLVQIVTLHGAPSSKVLELIIYLMPHYLGLAVPAAFFLSVFLGFRGLLDRSELVIFRNMGLKIGDLVLPVLILSVALTVIMITVNGFGKPHSRYAYRALTHEIKSGYGTFNLQPGVFFDIGDDITIRADSVHNDGQLLKGFFASRKEIGGSFSVFTAQRAEIVTEQPAVNAGENGANMPPPNTEKNMTFYLRDGVLIRDAKGGSPSELNFEQYPWRVSLDQVREPYGARGQDEREMTLPELVSGTFESQGEKPVTENARRAEFHARLVQSLSMMILGFLAIPLSLLGHGRSGRAYGLTIGAVIVILYEKTVGFGQAFAENGTLSPLIGIWLPFAFMAGLTYVLYDTLAGDAHIKNLLWSHMRKSKQAYQNSPEGGRI